MCQIHMRCWFSPAGLELGWAFSWIAAGLVSRHGLIGRDLTRGTFPRTTSSSVHMVNRSHE
jgi:hypothetical protein